MKMGKATSYTHTAAVHASLFQVHTLGDNAERGKQKAEIEPEFIHKNKHTLGALSRTINMIRDQFSACGAAGLAARVHMTSPNRVYAQPNKKVGVGGCLEYIFFISPLSHVKSSKGQENKLRFIAGWVGLALTVKLHTLLVSAIYEVISISEREIVVFSRGFYRFV
jgi:hypothetical protein